MHYRDEPECNFERLQYKQMKLNESFTKESTLGFFLHQYAQLSFIKGWAIFVNVMLIYKSNYDPPTHNFSFKH